MATTGGIISLRKRPADALDQMGNMVKGMDGKRLRYEDLIADGAPS